MLRIARRRLDNRESSVQLIHAAYPADTPPGLAPELAVFSYVLSMFNPGWEEALAAAAASLGPGGRLQRCLRPEWLAVRPAWGGCWEYFLFVGTPHRRGV
jgi:hypothetical protein